MLWTTQDPHCQNGLLSQFAGIYVSASQDWLRALYPFTMNLVRRQHALSTYTRLCFSVLTQNYGADVDIVPGQRFFDPRMLLSALRSAENEALIREGERATWPKIEIIRNCTEISRNIEVLLTRVDDGYADTGLNRAALPRDALGSA